jgi:uncharacterized protein YjiS (DUF1127 family)
MQNIITATQTRTGPVISSPLQALSQYLGVAWSHYATWRASRKTRDALNSLDDRMLADIGVTRGGIDAVVRDIERSRAQW